MPSNYNIPINMHRLHCALLKHVLSEWNSTNLISARRIRTVPDTNILKTYKKKKIDICQLIPLVIYIEFYIM